MSAHDEAEERARRIAGLRERLDEAELIAGVGAELAEREAPLTLVVGPALLLQLAGLMQLAVRHPSVTGHNRRAAEWFLGHVRAHFGDAPAVLELLRRGDDPANDV